MFILGIPLGEIIGLAIGMPIEDDMKDGTKEDGTRVQKFQYMFMRRSATMGTSIAIKC